MRDRDDIPAESNGCAAYEDPADDIWNGYSLAYQKSIILAHFTPAQWFDSRALRVGAVERFNDRTWFAWKALGKERGVDTYGYERAVDEVVALFEQARQADPSMQETAPEAKPHPALMTTCAADVTSRQVRWLWYPYIAHGMLCMVDGDPGTGKSLLLTQLAATLSRGYDFPDQCGHPGTAHRPPQNVLLMTREDSPSMTIRPRLDADKADVTKIFIASTWLDVEGKEQAFTLKHLPLLAAELQARPYGLVVLDPIQSFFGDADMHRANQTRPLMDGLGALAETFQCAIVCVRHAAKPGEGIGKAMLRGLGSVDIVGAARTALFVEQYPGDETRALMAQTKSNLGPKGRTQIFSKCEGIFAWERASRLTDEDLAGSGRGPNHRAFLEAILWLEKRLEDSALWNAKDIEQEAEEQDIGGATLKRAKKALRVVSTQIKGDTHAGWQWRLPPLQVLTPPSPPLPPTDSSGSTEATEPTETSDYKTTTYGEVDRKLDGDVVRDSVGPEVPEVSGVSVARGTVALSVDAGVNTTPGTNLLPLSTRNGVPPPVGHVHVEDRGVCNICFADLQGGVA